MMTGLLAQADLNDLMKIDRQGHPHLNLAKSDRGLHHLVITDLNAPDKDQDPRLTMTGHLAQVDLNDLMVIDSQGLLHLNLAKSDQGPHVPDKDQDHRLMMTDPLVQIGLIDQDHLDHLLLNRVNLAKSDQDPHVQVVQGLHHLVITDLNVPDKDQAHRLMMTGLLAQADLNDLMEIDSQGHLHPNLGKRDQGLRHPTTKGLSVLVDKDHHFLMDPD